MGNVDSKESQNDTSSDLIDKTLSILQGFYIEFFGMFLPGVVAVGLVGVLLGGLYAFVGGTWESVEKVLRVLNVSPFLSTLLVCFIAYMVGAIVFRREPKRPDGIATYRQWKQTDKTEKERLCVQIDELKWKKCSCVDAGKEGVNKGDGDKGDSACRGAFCKRYCMGKLLLWLQSWYNCAGWVREKARLMKINIDYPYPHPRKFLLSRHMVDLAKYVSWCEGYVCKKASGKTNCEKGKEGCSKHVINTIKHCVRFSGRSVLISDMTRNECHIRMLCSFWYILTFVFWMTLGCLCVVAGIYIVQLCGKTDAVNQVLSLNLSVHRTSAYLTAHLIGGGLVWYCRRNIEKGLHYVRTREVVMILQSAHILETAQPDIYGKIFALARNDAAEFANKYCRKCDEGKNGKCTAALMLAGVIQNEGAKV